jgi:predicted phage terminase large subunit-like protein
MVADWDDESLKKVLDVCFRESAKTVYAKIKFTQNIVYKKKRFLIYCCYDKAKAKGNLFDIARQLQMNKLLIRDFGQLFFGDPTQQKQSTKKSIGEFITVNSVKCLAMSIGESPRGLVFGAEDGEWRPDFWILDDMDVLKSVQTKEVIDKSWDWLTEEMLGGISDDCNIIFLGNRVKRDGLIPRLEAKIGVPISILKSGEGLFDGNGWRYRSVPLLSNGRSNWKDRFAMTQEEATNGQGWIYGPGGKLEDLGSISFSSQMLNVIDDEDTVFDIRKIEIFVDPPPRGRVNYFMASDLAISLKKTADETVHIVVGVDSERNLWVLDMFNGKVKPGESLDELFKLHKKWNPVKYGLEVVSFQKSMQYAIEEKQATDDYFFKVHELSSGEQKYERIIGLQPLVELGKIHVARHLTFQSKDKENIIEQFANFPYGTHDDIIDALAYIIQIAFPFYSTEVTKKNDIFHKRDIQIERS